MITSKNFSLQLQYHLDRKEILNNSLASPITTGTAIRLAYHLKSQIKGFKQVNRTIRIFYLRQNHLIKVIMKVKLGECVSEINNFTVLLVSNQ